MGPFLIIFIVLLVINLLFLAMAFIHTYIYGKSKCILFPLLGHRPLRVRGWALIHHAGPVHVGECRVFELLKPEDMMSPRMSAASAMLNRQLNPRLSVQPQVTLFELIRVSAGSSAYDAQVEGKRVSVQQGPQESRPRSVTVEG